MNLDQYTHVCQLVFLDLELTHLPEDEHFGPPDDSILEARRNLTHPMRALAFAPIRAD